MSNCDICTEKFNKNVHSCITCYCGFSACKTCWKSYILSSDNGAQCMSPDCDIKFNRKLVYKLS